MAESLRDRQRRQPSKPTWDLLWLPATWIVFLAGAGILPRTGIVPRAQSPWWNAIFWAGYGTAWLSFVVAANRLGAWLWRRRAGNPAAAGSVREQPRRPWRWALWFTIYLVAAQLGPLAPGLSMLWVFVVAGAVIVLVETTLQAVWRRGEAARRRREVADLAQQF